MREGKSVDFFFSQLFSPKEKSRSVSVVGLGYVGLPLALRCEERGYQVSGVDIDSAKVDRLKKRIAPYLNETETEFFKKSTMSIHTDDAVLRTSRVVIVCVPTPVYEDHAPNLEPLVAAAEMVGRNLRHRQVIIIESTVNPGVCDDVVLPLLESMSGLKAGRDFFFAHCPERINPGDSRYSVRTIPRVVGANDPESLARAKAFYASILDAEIFPMQSLKEAEAVKIVENSFRDINIAFVNELAMSFDRLGIDISHVIAGASSKPFSFMPHFPGCGVGGHCIPVDPYYLISYAKQNGFTHRFLSLAREINNYMPIYTVNTLARLIDEDGGSLEGVPVALLGLSYKRDVPDIRESPALTILEELKKRGALPRAFDPLIPDHSTVKSLDEALAGARGVIVATDHSVFRSALTPSRLQKEGVEAIVDGRNFLDKEAFLAAGIAFKGIGR